MDRSFDFNGGDVDQKFLEELTTNVTQIQDDVLEEIVTSNINTEYLRRFLDGQRFDKELFKKNVPVVTYDVIKSYIDRVTNGEPSDLISARPITGFLRSTGTSGGIQKLMPMNNELFKNMRFTFDLIKLVTSKHVDGAEQGKGMMFFFSYPEMYAPCGLPTMAGTSGYFKSDYFKNRPLDWYYSYTSPDAVVLCSDQKQAMYCHLLCGLLQRDEVARVGSIYASGLVRAIKYLEQYWQELCSNIRSGQVSEWITDLECRESVSRILERPHPELADSIERECNQKSWEGIVTRLWPRTKYIETIITGSMSQYIQFLEFHSNGLPLVSTIFGSSESVFGINLYPQCKPQDVSYTFLHNMLYFEFIPMEGNKDEIVDLADVKLGCCYGLVVTNFYGLYRIKVGDVVRVTGFYNNTPQFRYIRRENVVLTIDIEKTTEEDIIKGVNRAKHILGNLDLMLIDFTSCTDTSAVPGHYVLYWEMKARGEDGDVKMDRNAMEECCFEVEESLDVLYRRYRSKVRSIGALEIRVVERGAFDCLMDFLVSEGASVSQYKTPVCIKSPKSLEVLEQRVVGRFFSQRFPSSDPSYHTID